MSNITTDIWVYLTIFAKRQNSHSIKSYSQNLDKVWHVVFHLFIIMASNGHEGLEAIREGSYDVILCDVRMPGLDGPGLYRELEQHYPHLLSRMIFLTGDVLSPEARDFFEQVDCLRLIKPFRAREVRQLIQQMLAAQ